MTNGRAKAKTRRERRNKALGCVLQWMNEAAPQPPKVPWDHDEEAHLRSITRLQTCCKALRQPSAYVFETWRLLLYYYGRMVRYMGEFDSDPRWIENELQRVKVLNLLGPKAARSSLEESMVRFRGPSGMLYAIGGGQGGVECFACVLHNNMPGKTPDPRYGTWIEKEMQRLIVIHWIISWCPGLRCVLPNVWGLGIGEILECWFRAIPVGPKAMLCPAWTVSKYWECMPMARIKLQGGGYALLLRGSTRSS